MYIFVYLRSNSEKCCKKEKQEGSKVKDVKPAHFFLTKSLLSIIHKRGTGKKATKPLKKDKVPKKRKKWPK
jgi:hypothetical protein